MKSRGLLALASLAGCQIASPTTAGVVQRGHERMSSVDPRDPLDDPAHEPEAGAIENT